VDGASVSRLYNQNLMIDAQMFLGLSSADTAVMVAIGKGIGNTAAHEMSHQLVLPLEDCDKVGSSACPGTGPHSYFYEYFADSPATFSYIGSPLDWAPCGL
jgi:hypothetical protein